MSGVLVTEYYKKQPIHYVKSAVRLLPASMVNKIASFTRKTGLNLKDQDG